jgi:hypothetical protein
VRYFSRGYNASSLERYKSNIKEKQELTLDRIHAGDDAIVAKRFLWRPTANVN